MQKGTKIGQGRTAEVFAFGKGKILKLYYPSQPVEWAEREVMIGKTVMAAGLAVPEIDGQVVEVDGRHGVVYERIDGPTLLRALTAQPWKFGQIAYQLADMHAKVHTCTGNEMPSQRIQLEKRIQEAPGLSDQKKEHVLRVLRKLPDDTKLCHGDYHVDNVLLSSRGPVVIDWMTATQGHPLADVARTTLMMQIDPIPPQAKAKWLIQLLRQRLNNLYLKRYMQETGASLQEIQDWMLPTMAARLCDHISEAEKAVLHALIDRELNVLVY